MWKCVFFNEVLITFSLTLFCSVTLFCLFRDAMSHLTSRDYNLPPVWSLRLRLVVLSRRFQSHRITLIGYKPLVICIHTTEHVFIILQYIVHHFISVFVQYLNVTDFKELMRNIYFLCKFAIQCTNYSKNVFKLKTNKKIIHIPQIKFIWNISQIIMHLPPPPFSYSSRQQKQENLKNIPKKLDFPLQTFKNVCKCHI